MQAYAQYTQARASLPQTLFGDRLGGILWVAIGLTLLIGCCQLRQGSADSDPYTLAVASVSCGMLALMPTPAWYIYD